MIEIEGLSKSFGSLQALSNLNLSIAQGEIFGFIGPNGAGKSTTFKILATLLRPDQGRAVIDGFSVATQAGQVRRRIGYMPDVFGAYEDMSVEEYLRFFAALYEIEASRRSATVDGVLELTDLVGKRAADCQSLSRGMQQRLGLARVLLHDPKILLLDEPASGLDPRARIEIRELLKELRTMGKTILISSHILRELAELATSFAVIERGGLLFSGTRAELMAKVESRRIVDVEILERTAEALVFLKGLEYVKDVSQLGATELEVELESGRRGTAELAKSLIEAGYKVSELRRRELDLEAGFMALTRGQVA
jgi:ABC-2 type transport system ATP-binding protein